MPEHSHNLPYKKAKSLSFYYLNNTYQDAFKKDCFFSAPLLPLSRIQQQQVIIASLLLIRFKRIKQTYLHSQKPVELVFPLTKGDFFKMREMKCLPISVLLYLKGYKKLIPRRIIMDWLGALTGNICGHLWLHLHTSIDAAFHISTAAFHIRINNYWVAKNKKPLKTNTSISSCIWVLKKS